MRVIKGLKTISLFVIFLFFISTFLYSCGQAREYTGPFATGVDVTPGGQTIAVGATQQFVATVHWDNGTTGDLTTQVKWWSDNTSVAVVNESGLVFAISAGDTFIHAQVPGIYGNVASSTDFHVKGS